MQPYTTHAIEDPIYCYPFNPHTCHRRSNALVTLQFPRSTAIITGVSRDKYKVLSYKPTPPLSLSTRPSLQTPWSHLPSSSKQSSSSPSPHICCRKWRKFGCLARDGRWLQGVRFCTLPMALCLVQLEAVLPRCASPESIRTRLLGF